MPVTGDLSKLREFQKRMGKMLGVPEKTAAAVAPRVLEMTREGFDSKTDPYGGAWKGIDLATLKRGTISALIRSGAMRDAIYIEPLAARLKVILGEPYARYHISTGRRTLPKPGALPDRWVTVIHQEASKAFEATAKGAS